MKDIKQREFLQFILEKDVEFFEKYLASLTEVELQNFLDDNPEFLVRE